MVQQQNNWWYPLAALSVLALSSRFDGQLYERLGSTVIPSFQYSLCRVVLMVYTRHALNAGQPLFQYSLCRVVLMVLRLVRAEGHAKVLSVLALSSRFDGLGNPVIFEAGSVLSVLALSSRFDGHRWPTSATERTQLSVLALSSRFDGPRLIQCLLWLP